MKRLTPGERTLLVGGLLDSNSVPPLTDEQRLIRQCPECGRPVPPVTPLQPRRVGTHFLETYYVAPHLSVTVRQNSNEEVRAQKMVAGKYGEPDDVFSINYLKTRDAEMEPFCRDALHYLKRHKLIYEYSKDTANCMVDKLRNNQGDMVSSSSNNSSIGDGEEEETESDDDDDDDDDISDVDDQRDSWDEDEDIGAEPSAINQLVNKRLSILLKYDSVIPGKFTKKMKHWMRGRLTTIRKEAKAKHQARKQAAREAREAHEATKVWAAEDRATYLKDIQERVFKTQNKGQCVDPTPEQTMTVQQSKKGIRSIFNKLMSWGPPESDNEADSLAKQETWQDVNDVFIDEMENRKIDEKCDEGLSKLIEYHSLKSRGGCTFNKIPQACFYSEVEEAQVLPPSHKDMILQRMSTLCSTLTADPCNPGMKLKTPRAYRKRQAKVKQPTKEVEGTCTPDDAILMVREVCEKRMSNKNRTGPAIKRIVSKTSPIAESTQQEVITNMSETHDHRQFHERKPGERKGLHRKHKAAKTGKIHLTGLHTPGKMLNRLNEAKCFKK